MMTAESRKVILVGAGPAGLLLALLLAQHQIDVEVVEMLEAIDPRPRGAAYGPPAISVLRRAGVVDQIRRRGLRHGTLTWRRIDGSIITKITGLDKLPEAAGYLVLPVYDLSCLLYEELCRWPNAKVYFGHKVTDVGQDATKAWVSCENGQKFTADFVVGTDGASSVVRKSLFGNSFPGKTWDPVIVATDVYYDIAKYGYEDTSWIVDSEHWAVISQISQDGSWRVSYGEPGGMSHAQLRERMPEKLQRLLPGHPTPEQYRLKRFSPYALHQRCAERMRVGRILLAADAAHINNPMGGLGLTGGISDVGGLTDCLYGIYDGKASLEILDEYDRVRREIFWTITDPVSTSNLEKIRQQPSAAQKADDEFLATPNALSTDENFIDELAKADMRLLTDFTQFYDLPKPSE